MSREDYIAGRSGAQPTKTQIKSGSFQSGRQDRENVREQKSVEARKEAAQSMQQAGLSGVGDISSTTKKGQQAVKDYYKEREKETGQKMPENIQDVLKETPVEDKGIFDAGIDTVQNLWKDFSPMMNVLQATQGKDRIFKKLAAGEALTPEDKIVLANLIAANKKNPNVLGDIDFEKYDVKDAKGFKAALDHEIKDLEEYYTHPNYRYQSMIDDYLSGKPTGLKDSLFGMGSDILGIPGYSRIERDDKSLTLEGLKKILTLEGPQGIAYLKANDPAAYYSFTQPQTGRGIENLANLQVTEKMQGENPDLVKKIFAAREQVQRDRQGGGGGGAGIPSLAAVPTPFTDVNNNGILDNLEVAQATTTPATTATTTTPATTTAAATTPTPFDYTQWPQYTQQGIASPNLNPWYNTLQNYYGVG